MKTFSRIFTYIKENWYKIIIGILALFVVDGMQLVIPKALQWAIDGLNLHNSKSILVKNAILILIMAAGIGLFRFIWRYFIIGTAFTIEKKLRSKLYSHLQLLSSDYYNYHKTGDLMAHATNDITAVRMLFGIGYVAAFDGFILSIASAIFMFKISVKLTLFAVIPLISLIGIVNFFGKKMHKFFKKVQNTFSRLTERVQEIYSGIKVIKTFVQEDKEAENFAKLSKVYVDNNMQLVKYWGAFFPSIALIIGISIAIIIWIGGEDAILGRLSVGEFVAFIRYLSILAWPMMAIGWVINLYQRGKASMERLNVIFDTNPDIIDVPDAIEKSDFERKIEFKNVSFSYKNELVLENINFTLEKGNTLAIVGRTGSGKTTLINLLTRLWDIENGEILIDNIPLKKWKLDSLRTIFSVVPQSPFLFSVSIKENIAFANPEASDEEIIHAAKLASIHDDILAFPKGYDTIVGERGVTLSGGQKQRISLARAILKNSPIIILDDSLSAVDTDTEEQILDGIKNQMPNKTFIIIAHRISSIQHADKIIVLDNGKIIEHGKHSELLVNKGLYYKIYQRQQLEKEMEKE